MLAKDIMTTEVVTVSPDTSVSQIAQLLLKHRISGVPVIDEKNHVIGIVSEGDLMHRPESDSELATRSWWLILMVKRRDLAGEYSRSHGQHASDIMTEDVTFVNEETPVGDVARILEENHIKRVPVVRNGVLIGIISRANLLHGLATWPPETTFPLVGDDVVLRNAVLAAMREQKWTEPHNVNITTDQGTVHLWGVVGSTEVRDAMTVLSKDVPGVKAVENHLGLAEPWMFWAE